MNISFFSKRIGRLEFLIYVFAPLVLFMMLGAVSTILESKAEVPLVVFLAFYKLVYFFLFAYLFWFVIACIRRLHDMDKSGWYVLIPVGVTALIAIVTLGFGGVLGIFSSAIVLGLKRGTVGPNRFGAGDIPVQI